MAWTTPMTEASGNVWTAAHYNTYVRDNINALRDYMLGAQDLGGDWKIAGTRNVTLVAAGVAHGMTALVSTDTFGAIKSLSTTAGGVDFEGFSDIDATAVRVLGVIGTTTPTLAPVVFYGAKKNGTTLQALAASEKMIDFQNNGTSKGVMYGDGGVNLQGGMSVGYSGVPTSGALTVGDANFKIFLNGIHPAIFMNANGAGIACDRTNNIVGFISDLGSYSVRIASTGGVMIVGTGSPTDAVPRGSLQFDEVTAPAACGADKVYLFAKDNGAGKTQLMAQFSSGAAQQVAIQP